MSRALRKTFVIGREVLEAELRCVDGRLQGVVRDGEHIDVDLAVRRLDAHTVRLEYKGRSFRAVVVRTGDTAWVSVDGHAVELTVEEAGGGAAHHAGEEDFATSPMTGTVVKLSVAPGQRLTEGEELFVVEAMKMEYVVRARREVEIESVRTAVGDQVDQGGVVVTFVSAAGESA